jgi:hypothetical protein
MKQMNDLVSPPLLSVPVPQKSLEKYVFNIRMCSIVMNPDQEPRPLMQSLVLIAFTRPITVVQPVAGLHAVANAHGEKAGI